MGCGLASKAGFRGNFNGKNRRKTIAMSAFRLRFNGMSYIYSCPLKPHQLNQLVFLRSGFPTLAVNIKNAKHDFSTDDKK